MHNNKRKLLNDPVYGFITIPDDFVFDVIEHSFFQRLRRIQQLGLTHYVYPGALHTRFHHALGAMHLMDSSLEMIKSKGTDITEQEYISAILAILMHDIGHGPFSHALEKSLIEDVSHEDISLAIMQYFNRHFYGQFEQSIHMFQGSYPRPFFNQLISGQLDVDRLDYLTRDSFFTGVSEGVVGTERLIKMMNVCKNDLVIEEKGIYSVEKFLIARQLMYWQVYLHKTVISAEIVLIKVLQRAQELYMAGENVYCTEFLEPFLKQKINKNTFLNSNEFLLKFCQLDDFDVISSIKAWIKHPDKILSDLSSRVINRKLYRTIFLDNMIEEKEFLKIKKEVVKLMKIADDEAKYYIHMGVALSQVYDSNHNPILIFYRDGKVKNAIDATTTINLKMFTEEKKSYFLSFPKEIEGKIFDLIK